MQTRGAWIVGAVRTPIGRHGGALATVRPDDLGAIALEVLMDHPGGTCKVGTDAAAVVDPELRVPGIEGLRVADASVMPTIVCVNTNAASIMIGEKAADVVRGSGSVREVGEARTA